MELNGGSVCFAASAAAARRAAESDVTDYGAYKWRQSLRRRLALNFQIESAQGFFKRN